MQESKHEITKAVYLENKMTETLPKVYFPLRYSKEFKSFYHVCQDVGWYESPLTTYTLKVSWGDLF